ncbi:hypothetical protein [Streptomyces murinus]|uniref:hypothetical protein n=1 Tax=Streptomyces murinus TaxID=33900 RepID=UPI00380D4464
MPEPTITVLDGLVPKARAWTTVLVSSAWWRLPSEDRYAHRSGVELAFWTNRQIRRSRLCTSCWMRESEPDILFCDGGGCRNFGRLLETLT